MRNLLRLTLVIWVSSHVSRRTIGSGMPGGGGSAELQTVENLVTNRGIKAQGRRSNRVSCARVTRPFASGQIRARMANSAGRVFRLSRKASLTLIAPGLHTNQSGLRLSTTTDPLPAELPRLKPLELSVAFDVRSNRRLIGRLRWLVFRLLFRLKGLLVLHHFRRRGLDWRRRWRWSQT